MSEELKLTPEVLKELRRQPILTTAFAPCLCGKLLKVQDFQQKWHSGRWAGTKQLEPGVNYTDLLCGGCRKEFRNWPRIVCLGCRKLMGFVKPAVEKTGFRFETGRHYHIVECPQCNNDIASTPVLEHERFCKLNGIATTTNWDLLQEIEQKTLQGVKTADRLRAEFKNFSTQ